PPPVTPSAASPSSVCAGLPSVPVTVTGTSASGSEFFDPGPDPGGPGYAKHISATVTGGVAVTSASIIIPANPSNTPVTQVTLGLNTVGAGAGAQNVTIINPDSQSATGVGILTINPLPSEASGVAVASDKQTISWLAIPEATRYDVVRG